MNHVPVINFHMSFLEEGYETPLFSNPLEPVSGLTISDLNKYLPAILKTDDIVMTSDSLFEGLFLADALDGMAKLPENSIDLLITAPPELPRMGADTLGQKLTLQDFYQWNRDWLKEAYRVLKTPGSIYLATNWHYSGMYQSLLSDFFQIQTRISWRNKNQNQGKHSKVWKNEAADIWFATKSSDFMVNEAYLGKNFTEEMTRSPLTNFWSDLALLSDITKNEYDDFIPEQVVERIIRASTFKLSWVLDPFVKNGATGVQAKKLGRRFIGMEPEQDQLLISMKRIDQT